MWRPVLSQRPDINRATTVQILLREKPLINAHANAFGISVEMPGNQTCIADRGSDEDICVTSATDQVARDFRVGLNEMLRRRRLVVNVESVDVRALGQQVFGNF